jgi:hypothetical protein
MENNNLVFEQFNFPMIDEYTSGAGRYLSDVINDTEKKNVKTVQKILNNLSTSSPAFATLYEGLKKHESIIVEISEEAKRKLATGEWTWANAKDKDDFFRAFIKNDKGTVVEHALLKKKDICNGVNVGQMAMAMQAMAVQKQLSDISEKLDVIFDGINDLKIGQQNDRLGMYYSAEFLYREALKTNDPILQKNLIAQALSNLSVSVEQLKQTTIYEIHKIRLKYSPQKQTFKGQIKQEDVLEIKKNLQVIHKAVALKTAIYSNCGEINSAICSLLEYRDFLITSLSQKRGEALYLADINEKSLQGFWNERENKYPEQILKICKDAQDYNLFRIEFQKGELA